MGRGMTAKKSRAITRNDLSQAEARLGKKIEAHKSEAASIGTKAAFGLMFLALYRLYGWKWRAASKIQTEVDKIADEMTAGQISWDDIKGELLSIGIGLDI